MSKFNPRLVTLLNSLAPTEAISSVRHCTVQDCPHYRVPHEGKSYICKRYVSNPRYVEKGQECLDQLPKR
ncbi:MAG: hypothetical protein Q8Q31_01590 [Nanoarchaeota archaeon]|nr:hypothetical protein [Nanoarchaeota archaeon]